MRYYEKRGLIPPPPHSDGGYRLYAEGFVRRIRLVKRAQELGFTLSEIDGLRVDEDVDCGAVKIRTDAKIEDVEEKIRDLQRIRRALRRPSGAPPTGGASPSLIAVPMAARALCAGATRRKSSSAAPTSQAGAGAADLLAEADGLQAHLHRAGP